MYRDTISFIDIKNWQKLENLKIPSASDDEGMLLECNRITTLGNKLAISKVEVVHTLQSNTSILQYIPQKSS